jgi:catalase
MIGIVLVVVAAGFAYLGGWLTPGDLTPARFVDAFEQANGVHAGFRRNHAKGLGVSGFFESNGNGVRFSKAVVFRPGPRTTPPSRGRRTENASSWER